MNANFDQYVPRTEEIRWLKTELTPMCCKEDGRRGFTGAEFEFPTCPAFSKGVVEAAKNGLFGFTLPGEKYLNAVVWWMKQVRGFEVEPKWIVPTQGTIFSVATTLRLVTKPGEGMIVLTPGYNRYEQAAVRLGRHAVKVPLWADAGAYSIDFEALEKAMADKNNRLLVLCNPNNPTGNVWSLGDLERIAALSEKYGVTVFSDEIFAEVVFEGRVPSYAEAAKDSPLAICCTGMGKVFSLTGVNHANVIIPNLQLRERFIAQRNADHYGSLDPMVHAGLIASFNEEGKQWVSELNAYVLENYQLIEGFMKENLPGAVVTRPMGTYVVWIDYAGLGLSPEALKDLLTEGTFLGDSGEEYYSTETCMRYSIACPRQEIEKALEKLKTCLLPTAEEVRKYVEANYVPEEMEWACEMLASTSAPPKKVTPLKRRAGSPAKNSAKSFADAAPMPRQGSLEDFLANPDKTFQEKLFEYIDERGLTGPQVYRNYISKQVYSKILGNKDYHPNKFTAIALCLSLRLDLDQALDLMGRAGWSLSSSSKADLVVRFCFLHRIYDLIQINIYMDECGCDVVEKIK